MSEKEPSQLLLEEITVRNSRGSSAGAGSGDCHQYLQCRRRENFRLLKLEEEALILEKDQEKENNLEVRRLALEEQHIKRVEKRKKMKERAKERELAYKRKKNNEKSGKDSNLNQSFKESKEDI